MKLWKLILAVTALAGVLACSRSGVNRLLEGSNPSAITGEAGGSKASPEMEIERKIAQEISQRGKAQARKVAGVSSAPCIEAVIWKSSETVNVPAYSFALSTQTFQVGNSLYSYSYSGQESAATLTYTYDCHEQPTGIYGSKEVTGSSFHSVKTGTTVTSTFTRYDYLYEYRGRTVTVTGNFTRRVNGVTTTTPVNWTFPLFDKE